STVLGSLLTVRYLFLGNGGPSMETGKKSWRPFASVVSLTAILAVGLLSIDARFTTAAPGKGQAGAPQPPAAPPAPVQAPVPPAALSTEPVPVPTGGDIVDQAAAIALGKAFFWDVQVGSDGKTSCATCHTVGGADPRTFNTLHPGFLDPPTNTSID